MKKPLERLEMMRLAKREKLDRMWRRLIGDVAPGSTRRIREKRAPRWAR